MIKSLGLSLAIAAGVFLVAFGALWAATRDASMLNPSLIDEAQRASSVTVVASDVMDVAAPSAAPDPGARLEAVRQDAAKRALTWLAGTVGAALAAAWLWLVMADQKGRKAAGTKGQRSAATAWWGCLALVGVAALALGYYAVKREGFAAAVAAPTLQLSILIVGLAAFVTFYLGTAVAVPRLMRPSAPLATLWLR